MRNVLLAALVSLLLGTGIGYYIKAKFVAAAQKTALVELRKVDAKSVQDSTRREGKLQDRLDTTRRNAQIIQKESDPHVYRNPKVTCDAVEAGGDLFLGIRDVRLLNAARENRTADPATWRDAEVKAPSDITVAGFVQNDLQVVEQYHDLAQRHDELVDYVNALVERHNESIKSGN